MCVRVRVDFIACSLSISRHQFILYLLFSSRIQDLISFFFFFFSLLFSLFIRNQFNILFSFLLWSVFHGNTYRYILMIRTVPFLLFFFFVFFSVFSASFSSIDSTHSFFIPFYVLLPLLSSSFRG